MDRRSCFCRNEPQGSITLKFPSIRVDAKGVHTQKTTVWILKAAI